MKKKQAKRLNRILITLSPSLKDALMTTYAASTFSSYNEMIRFVLREGLVKIAREQNKETPKNGEIQSGILPTE